MAVIFYMTYFARGNVTHDYYQLPLVPVGCVLIAKGIMVLLQAGTGALERIMSWITVFLLVLMMGAFGWYEVRGFFTINHPEIIKAGQAVDALTSKDARVIAPYSKDPAFLYQTNRNGWTDWADNATIESWIQNEGATHIVSVNFDDQTHYWMDRCQIIAKTSQYVIIDLKHCGHKQTQTSNQFTINDVRM